MPQSQPGGESRLNSRSIRDHNLSLVLHELARTRGCSRSRLRETTGLTPGAVTLLVNELIDAGMIETSDTMRAEGGRRKKQLALAGDSYPVAVVELRRDGIAAALETFGGTRLMDVHAPKTFYGKSVEEFADAAAEQIVALDQCATESVERPLVAVGVVMPIGVLVDNSTILPIGAFGWDMVDLGSLIATRLREQGLTLPVVVLSAPACAGWAEYRALYDDESIETPQGVLYVAPDVTDGGSLIIRGRLYRGVLGTAVVAAIFLLACLNVCTGLISCCGTYFAEELPRVPYRVWAIGFAAFSCVISNFGLDAILAFSVPLLNALYPVAIVLVIGGMAHRVLDVYPLTWPVTVGLVGVSSVVVSLRDAFAPGAWVIFDALPFADMGLGWVLLAVVGIVLGVCLSAPGKMRRR